MINGVSPRMKINEHKVKTKSQQQWVTVAFFSCNRKIGNVQWNSEVHPDRGRTQVVISGNEPGKLLLSKRRRQDRDADKHTSTFFDKEMSSTFPHNWESLCPCLAVSLWWWVRFPCSLPLVLSHQQVVIRVFSLYRETASKQFYSTCTEEADKELIIE